MCDSLVRMSDFGSLTRIAFGNALWHLFTEKEKVVAMKLLLPEVLHHLEKKPFVLCDAVGEVVVMAPRSKLRGKFVQTFVDNAVRAVKFLFDSGSDRDEETVSAVRDTALAMLEANLFHLPFPTIWIEDPYEDVPEAMSFEFTGMRNFYLACETANEIELRLVQRIPNEIQGVRYMVHGARLVIDKTKPSDLFTVEGGSNLEKRNLDPDLKKTFGEAIYALKKFIVTLATEDVDRETRKGKPRKESVPKLYHEYDFTIIRTPIDRDEKGEIVFGPGGRKRRKHLVRGYVWGRLTRPLDEQRWIKPFWRGTGETRKVDYRIIR